MMPVVRIHDSTFANLKSISTWYGTTTPSETIDRIVRAAMEDLGLEHDDEPNTDADASGATAMEFTAAPGLTFTKPLSATVNGKAVPSPRWSSILLTMIAQVKARGFEGEDLIRELNIPAKVEPYAEEGFKYHPKLGISIQGQSAAGVWREVNRLATKWGIPVKIEFWWRQNPKAQHPGKTGILRSGRS